MSVSIVNEFTEVRIRRSESQTHVVCGDSVKLIYRETLALIFLHEDADIGTSRNPHHKDASRRSLMRVTAEYPAGASVRQRILAVFLLLELLIDGWTVPRTVIAV